MRNTQRVLKAALLQHIRRPEKVAWWFRDFGKTIPCNVLGDRGRDPVKEGFVWIQLSIPHQHKMSIAVPKDIVMMRHTFLRVWFPLTLLPMVQTLASAIRTDSDKNRMMIEDLKENGLPIGSGKRSKG